MVSFKDLFQNVPDLLKTTIFIRLAIAIASIIGFIVILIAFGLGLAFPFLAVGIFFSTSGVGMAYNCIMGKYISFEGKCTNIELTSVRGKIKAIYITSNNDEKILRLPPKEGSKKLNIKDDVVVYIPEKTLIHKDDGVLCVPEYYGIDIVSKEILRK